MTTDSRRKILERRSAFIAAALGAIAATAGCEKPEPCLSIVADDKRAKLADASVAEIGGAEVGGNEQPMPCLSESMLPDAPAPVPCLSISISKDAGPRDAGPKHAGAKGSGTAAPHPCLEIEPGP